MNIADAVAQIIIDMIDEDGGAALIRRNDLAQQIGCVPSQINYVITSRFTPEHGYLVESRRGGGGYILIKRANLSKAAAVLNTLQSIGTQLEGASCRNYINNLNLQGYIGESDTLLMMAATSDNALKDLNAPARNVVRAAILKQLLLEVANQNQ